MSKLSLRFWLIFIPTIALFYFSLQMALILRYHGSLAYGTDGAHYKVFSLIFAMWLVVFYIHGLFEIQAFRRYSSLFFNLVSAMAINLLLAIIYFYFQPNLILTPRRILLLLVGIAFIFLLFWYLLVKYVFKNRLAESVYLFSFNNEPVELEEAILQHAYLGFKVLGRLNQQSLTQASLDKNSSVILPDNLHANPQIAEQLYRLRTAGVRFYNYKDFYENLLRRVYLSQINEIWFLENINYQEKRFYNLIKRIVDILLGLVGFSVFLISYPFCALAIKLTSPGPVLFNQERAGKAGKLFKVYKYRTMDRADYKTWTNVNDNRITKVGKFLRKSRIDEWPQFINLLLGHISLVGPRPEQPHIVEELKTKIPFYDERHLVKPGITGWAQLNIYAGSLEESKLKLQYDLYYIKHRSFLFDLEIILKTIYYIFTWQGR